MVEDLCWFCLLKARKSNLITEGGSTGAQDTNDAPDEIADQFIPK